MAVTISMLTKSATRVLGVPRLCVRDTTVLCIMTPSSGRFAEMSPPSGTVSEYCCLMTYFTPAPSRKAHRDCISSTSTPDRSTAVYCLISSAISPEPVAS